MATSSFGMDANKSFYQYWMLLGGVSFGVAELSYLRNGDIADVRVLFPAIVSTGFLVVMLWKKKQLESSGEVLAALSRRYRHISADYLCTIGTTSLFSMLAYVVMNSISLAQGWSLTPFAVAILVNAVLLGYGMTLLSGVANDERKGA
jgi:hypothetical protein